MHNTNNKNDFKWWLGSRSHFFISVCKLWAVLVETESELNINEMYAASTSFHDDKQHRWQQQKPLPELISHYTLGHWYHQRLLQKKKIKHMASQCRHGIIVSFPLILVINIYFCAFFNFSFPLTLLFKTIFFST